MGLRSILCLISKVTTDRGLNIQYDGYEGITLQPKCVAPTWYINLYPIPSGLPIEIRNVTLLNPVWAQARWRCIREIICRQGKHAVPLHWPCGPFSTSSNPSQDPYSV